MKLLKSFLSELKSNHRFTLLFVINLSLGLAGFVALDAFRVSIDLTMKSRSKKILGSDLGISARRPLTEKEVKTSFSLLPEGTQQAQTTEFYSMVAPTASENRATRLVKIKAVDSAYPFYGGMKFLDGSEVEGQPFQGLNGELSVWVYKELLFQLDIKKGDQLKVGEQVFNITRVIVEDSTAGMGASFAPTVYIGQSSVPATGLISKGSVAWHSRLYKLPTVNEPNLNQYKDKIFESAEEGDLRVYTHLEASEQMARLLQTLNDYLGLVAIVALLLAAVGTGFLYRSFFSGKVMQVAVLMTLGLSQTKAAVLYMLQLMALGLTSSVVAVALGFLMVPVIGDLTQELLAIPFVFVIPQQTFLLAACLGVFGSFLVGLPFLAQIRQLSPALLLKGDYAQVEFSTVRFLVYSLPALLALWGLSIWQAHSLVVGSSFLAALLATAVALVGVAIVLLRVLRSLSNVSKTVSMKFAMKDMAAHSWTSISCFLAIGLGAVLINLVPQVRASLQQELTAPETTNLPSLFMFDIQEPQVDKIRTVTTEQDVELKQLSPMVRARLISVNDEPFDKGKGAGEGLSREEQREMRFRNRGFNLSYRDGLSSSESLFAGELFSGEFVEADQELPYVSVERRFADRLGLKIGDVMEFDVESIAVKGIIRNLRSVRWTTFQPNFFIQFQPGVLELAPKTFIAVTESLSEERKASLQKAIVEAAPNVSMIDVSRLVERITEIISQMSVALFAMAVLCFFAGFVVIYSIAQHQAEKQRWQMGLLKVLGSSFQTIWFQFVVQFGILSGLAALLGVLVSVMMSYVISSYLFESLWVFDWRTPILSFVLIVFTTLAVVSFASFRALQVKPNALLK